MSISVSKIWACLLLFALASCKPEQEKELEVVTGVVSTSKTIVEESYPRLSDFSFFQEPIRHLVPKAGVVPYELAIPLFSDYADKDRFVVIPKDSLIGFESAEVMNFPEGTIIIKNFSYSGSGKGFVGGVRRIETRLLEKKEGKWVASSYVWNDEQTDAFYTVSGADLEIDAELATGRKLNFTYRVPSTVQCKSCHLLNGEITPIGPTARQLNSTIAYSPENERNQLEYWSEHFGLQVSGTVDKLASSTHYRTGELDRTARAYLDINCGHCHREGAAARNSGLNLHYYNSDLFSLGIMKPPVAAGRGSGGLKYDIVPGKPNQSILLYRMKSTDPEVMMPEVSKSIVHQEGVELITAWIESLEK